MFEEKCPRNRKKAKDSRRSGHPLWTHQTKCFPTGSSLRCFLGWLAAAPIALFILLATSCTNPSPQVSQFRTPAATSASAVASSQPISSPTINPSPTAKPSCDQFTPITGSFPGSVPTYSYRIINSYPHDPGAFTQGLIFDNGILYESTGTKRTASSLRQVDLVSGEVTKILELGSEFFGEGVVLWEGKLIQLTWQNNLALVYDQDSFELLEVWQYESEGWGITHNGRCLIMSDGSDILYFRDPDTFAEVGRLPVQDSNGPVRLLNELEFINGEVWANIWQSNRIVRIDPATGQVTGNVDLTGLLDPTTLTQPVDVLNGIAYDAANGRLFITGKLWPTLFEIELIPAGSN